MPNKQMIYDHDTQDLLEKVETGQLLSALLHNIKTLQAMIVDLREEVNALDPNQPYRDLHSDIYACFDDYVALQKHAEYIEPELLEDY